MFGVYLSVEYRPPRKNTHLENVAKLDLKLSVWDKNTSMDAQGNGEMENVDFTLFGCVMVEHCNVFGGTSFLTSPRPMIFENCRKSSQSKQMPVLGKLILSVISIYIIY